MKYWPVLILGLFTFCTASGQVSTYHFRSLTTNDGLSDGVIRAIAQDKYGFIWIGTSYGLNRFDGTSVKTFFVQKNDSTSLPDNYIKTLRLDLKGNLWVATLKGLCRYDYAKNCFINYSGGKHLSLSDITQDNKGRIWVSSNDGLWIVDEKNRSMSKWQVDPSLQQKLQCVINRILPASDGNFYLSTNCGIKIYNPETNYYSEITADPAKAFSISSNTVYSLAIDHAGYLWAACANAKSLLNRIDLRNQTVKYYYHFSDPQKKWSNNQIGQIFIDSKQRMWGTGTASGLFRYDEKNDSFFDYRSDPMFSGSMLADQSTTLLQDASGNIWVGTNGYGISYFNPDQNLFRTIIPIFTKNNPRPVIWCRAACEDKAGNIWLATGSGVTRYDRTHDLFTNFSNEENKKPTLYINSVRSLLADDNDDIWIGTARGLNRYHPGSGVMDFFDDKQGMPLAFFWMLAKTSQDEVWIGSTSGLFHYLRSENRFDDLTKDSLFSKFSRRNIQALYCDKQDRLWIGILDVGLVIYDLRSQKIDLLTVKDSLITDTRFSSFAEDKNGIMWIGSENGLTAFDIKKRHSVYYTRENGLPSNRTNNLMVDYLNRLWIGTSNGLCVMNRERNRIRRFDINDGLPANQFNEQAALMTHDGLYIFPTYRGFALFRPEDYKENRTTVPLYITSFKISENELKTDANPEEMKNIKLAHDQNFFSIELSGLNYMNPLQCMFAYRLEPFDKDWVYSRNKHVNYTNVPAGDYVFHYKVITDNPTWNVQEKTLAISVAAIFYETGWFRGLVIVLIITGLIAFFRYRMRQRERILLLQNKAQMLEKEKAMVMYESLKQQLNPHFLFNSLTSLSSLIQQDQKIAKQFLDQMSKIYRYILQNRDSELVPLIEDMKLAEVYTKLQQTRFQKGLFVNMNVTEENYHRKIAPVTLQNLFENAIKHNIIDAETPLHIDVFVDNDYLVVKNNLQKKNFVETSNKQGLANMKSLYQYLNGKSIGISQDEKYFTVKIPLV